jgi:hypothetical protein
MVERTFDFIESKTSGKRKTLAKWIRDFVESHPEYK